MGGLPKDFHTCEPHAPAEDILSYSLGELSPYIYSFVNGDNF